MAELTGGPQSGAWAGAYDLLGAALLNGPQGDVLCRLTAVPELAALVDGRQETELLADHYGLFGLNIHAFANVFLDPRVLAGGDEAEALSAAFASAGFTPRGDAPSLDHVSVALEFLVFLLLSEAEADGAGATRRSGQLRDRQRDFIDRHLLTWLPALVQAVRAEGSPLYGSLVELLSEVVLDHRRALGPGAEAAQVPLPPGLGAAGADAGLLARPETSLADIARYLATPCRAGLFLSRSAIQRLGRTADLPRGFADRTAMVENLLHAAARYTALPALAAALTGDVDEWTRAVAGRGGNEAANHAWLERLGQTRTLLADLDAGAHQL